MSSQAFDVSISVTESGRRRPQYSLDTDLNGEVTLLDFLEWTKSALIVTADEVLKDEQAKGFDKSPVTLVDNRANRSPKTVHPLGQIEFVSKKSMDEIVLETYNAILHRSKVLTGLYKSSHFVFLNGKQVATDLQSLASWLKTNPDFKESDFIRFVNIQPYARKLERFGVTAQKSSPSRTTSGWQKRFKSGGSLLVSVPSGAYALTARAIRAKYKRNSTIKFTFLSGSAMGLSASFKSGKKGSKGRPYLYPSITISVKEAGIL